MPQQFLHNVLLFKIAQMLTNVYGLLLQANLFPRTFENRQNWSHWLQLNCCLRVHTLMSTYKGNLITLTLIPSQLLIIRMLVEIQMI